MTKITITMNYELLKLNPGSKRWLDGDKVFHETRQQSEFQELQSRL